MSLLAILLGGALITSAASPNGGGGFSPGSFADHLSPATERGLLQAQEDGAKQLRAAGKLPEPRPGSKLIPQLHWPLTPKPGIGSDNIGVSNFVDLNPAFPDQLRDYSCQRRTYDTADGYNHGGTDFFTWPFPWSLQDAGAIDVVAAATGTIIAKADGNYDRECTRDSDTPNYVFIQHDDGTVAWYLHLKSGSTTQSPVGARVVAGEYLGKVGSSGNSSGPHLHFEVRANNSQTAVVLDPFQGSCNSFSSAWIEQRPYFDSKIARLATHSAPPLLAECPSTSETPNLDDRFEAGARIVFAAYYTDQRHGQQSQFRILRPDQSVYRSWTHDTQDTGGPAHYVASYWYWSYEFPTGVPEGRWTFEATYQESTRKHHFSIGAASNHSFIYWKPDEPGWGLNLQHQGELLYATWYSYAEDSKPMFLTIEGTPQNDGSFSGPIYRVTGTPLALINGSQAFNSVTQVGSAQLRFPNDEQLEMDYEIGGVAQSKKLESFVFAQVPPLCFGTRASRANASNYSDLWWKPSEAGWGLSLSHQGDSIFALWYTYGEGGRDQWLSASALLRQPDGSFQGALQRALSGTPLLAIDDAATAFPVPEVGSARLDFGDGEHAVFSYNVDGVSQSKAIQRFVAVGPEQPKPLCVD